MILTRYKTPICNKYLHENQMYVDYFRRKENINIRVPEFLKNNFV